MDLSIRKFIANHQEKGQGYYTHVSLIQPTGCYNIQRKEIEQFWELYCNTLYNNKNMISGLAERPMDYMPVLNDTDLKVEYDSLVHDVSKKFYKDTHIRQTVMIYQKHLKQIIKDYKPRHGVCFVLEKELPTVDEKNRIGHGFHLHFINTFMNKVDQDVHLIPRIRKEVDDKNLFADLGITDSKTAIDASCTSKNWLLYGSRKKEKLQSYKVTKIYNDDCQEISLEQALSDFELKNIHGDVIEMDFDRLEYYLPRILSVHPENRDPVFLKNDLDIITRKYLKKAEDSKRVFEDLPVPEALKRARELMKLISSIRADNYDDWIDIGWTLFNIGDGTEEAFKIWVDFSATTSNKNYFSEKVCIYEWGRMEKRNKSIGSLHYYAKTDSPDKYKEIQRRENDRLFSESLNGGHYDMAKWLHNKYRDEFVCACIEKDVWFRYKKHRWILNKKGIDLRKKISIELVDEYRKLKKKICNDMGDQDDDVESQKKLKTVNKIIAQLKTAPFKKNIMVECQELFFSDNFAERLDSDPYLMHFSNGVLDMREMRLREGRPTDYLSLTTGYDFKEHSRDDIEVIELEDHLSKVFPDPQLKQYFVEYAANLLKGGNNIKTYLNMSGEGDNGKSINMDLLKLVLGKYMKILPTALVIGKRTQSSQATPELSGIQGVRFAVLQEPNSKDILNIGILKELTGNDVIYIRGLYKDAQEVRPMFKLAMICNALPRLPCDDPAAWNRIRVLLHEACFPKDASSVPETLEEQIRVKRFPRDPFFSEKLPRMKTAFMWLLWEEYKRIQVEGRMPEPEKVREATNIYRRDNDVFLQFISERIVEDSSEKAIMSVIELYNAFKSWFNDSYPNLHHSIPSKEDMKNEMIKKWGELNSAHKWRGYRLRTLEDDEREGKAIILRDEDLAAEDEKKAEPEGAGEEVDSDEDINIDSDVDEEIVVENKSIKNNQSNKQSSRQAKEDIDNSDSSDSDDDEDSDGEDDRDSSDDDN